MADIHFGTDGWRAIIGEDFTDETLARTVDAAARVFKEDRDARPSLRAKTRSSSAMTAARMRIVTQSWPRKLPQRMASA